MATFQCFGEIQLMGWTILSSVDQGMRYGMTSSLSTVSLYHRIGPFEIVSEALECVKEDILYLRIFHNVRCPPLIKHLLTIAFKSKVENVYVVP